MSQHQPHLKKTWKYKTKNSMTGDMEGVLVAYWQAEYGSISDNYTRNEISKLKKPGFSQTKYDYL